MFSLFLVFHYRDNKAMKNTHRCAHLGDYTVFTEFNSSLQNLALAVVFCLACLDPNGECITCDL